MIKVLPQCCRQIDASVFDHNNSRTSGPTSNLPVSLWDCGYMDITRKAKMKGDGHGANMDEMYVYRVL